MASRELGSPLISAVLPNTLLAMATMESSVSERIRVDLAAELVNTLRRLSDERKMSLEAFIGRRLATVATWDSDSPLVLSESERRSLESLLGKNFQSGGALVKAIERISRVRIGKTDVALDALLNERLRTRCPRNDNFDAWLSRLVVTLLEGYAGMR